MSKSLRLPLPPVEVGTGRRSIRDDQSRRRAISRPRSLGATLYSMLDRPIGVRLIMDNADEFLFGRDVGDRPGACLSFGRSLHHRFVCS